MRYVKAAVAFAIGGLAIVALAMSIQVYVGGYTYRNTAPLANWSEPFGLDRNASMVHAACRDC